ncbi:MAG: type II toxin-antitoxin system Phd/YefM family antitoxin [Betaproteobacteria bacterium]|nr:type II toxin-antitoxin system Phd/YefM family antitoxin [Betaproteobacteria bacterium]
MNWNVAQAKQRLSEMIREAAHEPQMITNRNRPVAALIAAEDLAGYAMWKSGQAASRQTTLGEAFAELRRLAAGAPDPLPDPDRFAAMRPNAFVDRLEEEYPLNASR